MKKLLMLLLVLGLGLTVYAQSNESSRQAAPRKATATTLKAAPKADQNATTPAPTLKAEQHQCNHQCDKAKEQPQQNCEKKLQQPQHQCDKTKEQPQHQCKKAEKKECNHQCDHAKPATVPAPVAPAKK